MARKARSTWQDLRSIARKCARSLLTIDAATHEVSSLKRPLHHLAYCVAILGPCRQWHAAVCPPAGYRARLCVIDPVSARQDAVFEGYAYSEHVGALPRALQSRARNTTTCLMRRRWAKSACEFHVFARQQLSLFSAPSLSLPPVRVRKTGDEGGLGIGSMACAVFSYTSR